MDFSIHIGTLSYSLRLRSHITVLQGKYFAKQAHAFLLETDRIAVRRIAIVVIGRAVRNSRFLVQFRERVAAHVFASLRSVIYVQPYPPLQAQDFAHKLLPVFVLVGICGVLYFLQLLTRVTEYLARLFIWYLFQSDPARLRHGCRQAEQLERWSPEGDFDMNDR